MHLDRVLELYENLEDFLRKYGDNSILQSYRIAKITLIFLNQIWRDKKRKNK